MVTQTPSTTPPPRKRTAPRQAEGSLLNRILVAVFVALSLALILTYFMDVAQNIMAAITLLGALVALLFNPISWTETTWFRGGWTTALLFFFICAGGMLGVAKRSASTALPTDPSPTPGSIVILNAQNAPSPASGATATRQATATAAQATATRQATALPPNSIEHLDPRERFPIVVYLGPQRSNSAQMRRYVNDMLFPTLRVGGLTEAQVGKVLYSYSGGGLNSTAAGEYGDNDYTCAATFQTLEADIANLRQLLLALASKRERIDYLLVGEGIGGTVAWQTAYNLVAGSDPVLQHVLRAQDSRIGAVVTWGVPLMSPSSTQLDAVAEGLLHPNSCPSVAVTTARTLLETFPTAEVVTKQGQVLQGHGVLLLSYVATTDHVASPVPANVVAITCNFRQNSSMKPPSGAKVVWPVTDYNSSPALYMHLIDTIRSRFLGIGSAPSTAVCT